MAREDEVTGRALAVVAVGLAMAALAACTHPLARRTYVFAVPGHTGYEHPAAVPPSVLDAALAGRVDPSDLPGLAVILSREFARLDPDHVLYYRRPDGGAYLFAVAGGELVVEAYGLAPASGAGRYPLAHRAAGPGEAGPPKKGYLDEATPTGKPGVELEIEAAIAIEQFVFVNGRFVGTVPAGQTRVFQVAPGRAVVSASDDGDDAVNVVTESFELTAGYHYRWSIIPRL